MVGGKVASYDASEAKKVPGVVQIVEIPAPPTPSVFLPLGGIAVVADNTWAAIQGRKALKIEWDDGPNAAYDSKAFREAMEATARKPGLILRSEGDFASAFAGAAKKVEAEYYIPHLAHATMEPPSATARIADGKAEVWTSVQSPQAAHDLVAKVLNLPPDNVTVHVTLLGGGFGRKSKPDYAVEAALISKGIGGDPVKVVWTREDDIQNGFYHTVSVERLEGGLDKDGHAVALRHNSTAPTIMSTFLPDPKHEANWEAGMGLVDMPFEVKNISIENGEAAAHARIGWYRSVSNISHAFAIQSFAAELAAAAGKDQRTFILELIGPARIVDVAQYDQEFLGLWRESGHLSDRYWAAARRRRTRNREGGLGPASAERPWPRTGGPPQLRDLCSGGRGSGGRREGQPDRSPRRCGHRLRADHQSGSRSFAVGGRGHHGSGAGHEERNLLQERQGPAEQLRRLPGDPH